MTINLFCCMLFFFFHGPQTPPDIDILALNGEMKTFLAKHVEPKQTQAQRLRFLIYSIFNEEFLDLKYNNTKTKTAIETFEARNGNCLSFTNMFVAMARHLGITAYFQEVYSLPTWDQHDSVVVLNRHINAVVILYGEKLVVDFNPVTERNDLRLKVISDTRAKAQYYNNVGAEFFTRGQIHTAISYLTHSLKLDETMSAAWSNLGVAYRKLGQFEAAEKAYQKALKFNRREYTAMANLARLYRLWDRNKEAERFEKKVQSFRERNPYYHYNLAQKAYEKGDFKKATKLLKRAIRRKAKEHRFHFELAKAYTKLGLFDKASKQLKKARAFTPKALEKDRYSQKLKMLARK